MGELVSHSRSIHNTRLLFWSYLGAGVVILVLHSVYLRRFVSVRSEQDGERAKYYEEAALYVSSGRSSRRRRRVREACGRTFSSLASLRLGGHWPVRRLGGRSQAPLVGPSRRLVGQVRQSRRSPRCIRHLASATAAIAPEGMTCKRVQRLRGLSVTLPRPGSRHAVNSQPMEGLFKGDPDISTIRRSRLDGRIHGT